MNWKVLLYLGVGVLLALAFNNTISGFVNPLLSSVKLNVSVNS